MEKTFYLIILILIIWWAIKNLFWAYFYSPKTHIKDLWREIFDLEKQIREYKNLIFDNKFINELDDETKKMFKDPVFIREHTVDDYGGWSRVLEKAIGKRKKLIKTLLDYYFDKDKDEEYIKENDPLI